MGSICQCSQSSQNPLWCHFLEVKGKTWHWILGWQHCFWKLHCWRHCVPIKISKVVLKLDAGLQKMKISTCSSSTSLKQTRFKGQSWKCNLKTFLKSKDKMQIKSDPPLLTLNLSFSLFFPFYVQYFEVLYWQYCSADQVENLLIFVQRDANLQSGLTFPKNLYF